MESPANNLVKMRNTSCHRCGVHLKTMKRCTGCQNVFYCSRRCQIEDWNKHRVICKVTPLNKEMKTPVNVQEISNSEVATEKSRPLLITVKSNHKKHRVSLESRTISDGAAVMQQISRVIRVSLPSMKLVGQGKVVTSANIQEMLQKCKVFQAFGEEAEDESGMDAQDIKAIMDELQVSRNNAIRSLRSCNGDLIDAIIELGNKL